jgi:glyoxylate utilization-related uncharacterized protein
MSNGTGLKTQALSHARLLEHELPALPGTEQPGFQRTAYEGLTGPDFRTVLIRVPAQQQSTFRVSSVDHIILVLEGELHVSVEDEGHAVDKWGQIFVPHGVGWTYRNPAQTEATFVSITNTPGP